MSLPLANIKVLDINLQHHYYSLNPRRVRGRNTENLIRVLDHEMAHCQQKRYVVMKFVHNEKHIVFSDIGKGRRRMEVFDEIKVIIAMN